MMRGPERPAIRRRRRARTFGRVAEDFCAWFLRLKGYRILARGFRTPVGEIDLVAARWGTLAIVEVKARRNVAAAAEALAPANAPESFAPPRRSWRCTRPRPACRSGST
jgi:putative endonuclease